MKTACRFGRGGVVTDSRGEVANKLKPLVRLEKRRAHATQVKPSRTAEARVTQAVVQVEPVDVGDHALGTHGGDGT